MKKTLLTLLVLSSSLFTLSAQSWQWGRQGTGGNDEVNAITYDKFHNVYLTGTFEGDTLQFGSYKLSCLRAGTSFYIVKYDQNGNVKWAEQVKSHSVSISEGNSLATDYLGYIYATGEFEDTISFGSKTLISAGAYNAFLVKYDSNGNVLWAKQSNGTRNNCNAVTADKYGNVYISGAFANIVSFGDDTLFGPSYSTLNFFIVRYDSDGSVKWANQSINSVTSGGEGYSLITDKFGYVYVTGFFGDTITLGTKTLYCNNKNGSDILLVKYDSIGNVIWAKQSNTPSAKSSGLGRAIAMGYSGDLYISGVFDDTLYIGTDTIKAPIKSADDIFWAKYDTSGNFLWAKQAYNLDGLDWRSYTISVDASNNLYLAGGAYSTTNKAKVVFDTDTLSLTYCTDPAVWLVFDSTGKVLSSYIYPSGGDDYIGTIADSTGCYVYYGGDFYDTTLIFAKDTLISTTDEFPFVARSAGKGCNTLETEKTLNQINNPSIELYPNPNQGMFTINSSGLNDKSYIEIYNMLGEKIYWALLKRRNTEVNIGNKTEGVYLYRVITEQGKFISAGKFIIL